MLPEPPTPITPTKQYKGSLIYQDSKSEIIRYTFPFDYRLKIQGYSDTTEYYYVTSKGKFNPNLYVKPEQLIFF